MIKQLFLLNGLAIVAVVWAHATQWVFCAMFWWTNRYRPVTVPNYDQLGNLAYYGVVIAQKLCVFAIPAFLFVSGFFIAYAARGQSNLSWKIVRVRIGHLLVPYLIWTVVIFIGDFLQGTIYTPVEYLRRLAFGEAVPAYYYVFLLCQLYVLSPLLVPIARARGWQLLFISALVLLGVISLFYLKLYQELSGTDIPLVDRMIELLPNQSFARFIFFFVAGIVFGFHLERIKPKLILFKWKLLAVMVLLAPLATLETELIFRSTGMDWRNGVFTITGSLYAITFILVFLAFDKLSLPYSKLIYELGRASFGIYLLHTTALEFFARAIQKFLPGILAYQNLFQVFLTILSVAGVWLFMMVVAKSPVRKSYRYLFG